MLKNWLFKVRGVASLLFILAVAFPVHAKQIQVKPGQGTIAAAVVSAQSGDLLLLTAGEFHDSLTLPEGVHLKGAGADVTRLLLTGDIGIECQGSGEVISDMTIEGELTKLKVGVSSDHPVRVERVRFEHLKVGVFLKRAPLSDVVACEFDDCEVGVWGEMNASPTVWGCRFEKCGLGVYGNEGATQIHNCLFLDSLAGIQQFVGAPDRLCIIRNNVFMRCGRFAMEFLQRTEPIGAPSIRNNVVYQCRAVLMGTPEIASRTSHILMKGVFEPIFRDTQRQEIDVQYPERSITIGEPGLSIERNGSVKLGAQALVRNRGLHTGWRGDTRAAWIGIEPAWTTPGTRAPAGNIPVRFNLDAQPIIVNGQIEEYQVLELMGRTHADGSREEDAQRGIVTYTFDDGTTVLFDARRYIGEANLPSW